MADNATTTTEPENVDKTFTQAELDSILKDRLNRQRAQLEKDTPNEEELQALRDKAAQFEAIDNASKDDLEKANETIEELQRKLSERDSEVATLTTDKRDLTVKQAVLTEASKAQFGEEGSTTFIDPEDALRFLDMGKVEFDDEGTPSNVGDLVKAVAGDKPHLLGERQAPPADFDLGPRVPSTDRPDETPEQAHGRWLAENVL